MHLNTSKQKKKAWKSDIVLSAGQFGNHPDSRNVWKAKPIALNRQIHPWISEDFLP